MKSYKPKKLLLSPLERFWKDQDQKLAAHDGFRDELGTLFDDTLTFRSRHTDRSVDLSVFDFHHLKVESAATLNIDGKSYPLSMKEYAKLALVANISGKSGDAASAIYQMMVHVAGFLNEQEYDVINHDNLEAFHISFLTQSVNNKGWFTRLSAPSYSSFYSMFYFYDSRMRLKSLGVDGVFDQTITKNRLEKTLDNACRSVMGMTLSEYKKGGSFNSLTLEMGQYYVDHMKRVYEQNFFYTLVCERAIKSVRQQFDLTRAFSRMVYLSVLNDTIRGQYTETKKRAKKSGKVNCQEIHDAMTSTLYEQYLAQFDKVQSLREENICQVVKALELHLRFDSVEVIRLLMLQKYYDFGSPKTPESVWQGYLRSLDKTEVKTKYIQKLAVHDVYMRMADVVSEHRLDNASFMASLSQWSATLTKGTSEDGFKDLVNRLGLVKDAMCCLVVAWLGYRRSEFGFPLSAIHVESNLDVLDNNHVPFRFKLKWVVPKTNGETKLDREITSQCYQLAAQLNDVFEPVEGAPCLYANENQGATSNRSTDFITDRVGTNWPTFVSDYEPFVAVHGLQRLTAMRANEMSEEAQTRLDKLRTQYDLFSARVQHLLAASIEVNRDLVKLKCTKTIGGSRQQKAFKVSLMEYTQTGDVSNNEHRQVIEKHLSGETKQWLQSDGVNLDQKGMKDIGNELLQDVRYPTPHAFRHIWAEAVLTRYQGDVGAVIRHQFCHMDDSFFMAYLRDKEVKGLMQASRIKLVNSIVDTLLLDPHQIGSEYVGGFARFMKKATSLTQAVTDNDIRTLRDRIVDRVISIQPSPFVTCIPREGSEAKAMCSEMGSLNPQNAKPEFCLVCINGYITSGNIKGIWKTIQPFVKECLDEQTMGFMVQSHLPTLRSSYKRIDELKSKYNAGSVDKILRWIKKAIDSVEKKLAGEEGLYV